MRHFAIACSCLLVANCLAASAAFAVDRGMISNAEVGPAGLQVRWFTQVATGVRGSVIDIDMNVNENKSTTFFDIEFGRGREVISQHDLDAFGNPRGIEGAQEYAELRKEIIEKELAARGFENTQVTIQKYTLPESTLYVYTSDGLVTAINADTGETKWATQVGTYRHPSIGVGANNKHVAAVNGTTVYCLDAATGKVLFTAMSKGSVSASPAVSDDFIYVPQLDGRLEVFPIITKGVGSERYIGDGRVKARPTITNKSVSWTTTKGYLNVALNKNKKLAPPEIKVPDKAEEETLSEDEKENLKLLKDISDRIRARDLLGAISYRLRTGDRLVSQAVAKSGMLYVTSLGGFVYAVDEAKGTLEWDFSTGEEIDSQPIAIGNHLYLVTAENSLFKLDAQTGSAAWEQPISRISQIVGASKDKLFVVGHLGNLLVLSQNDGQLLGEVRVNDIDLVYQNSITDRMFVGNTNGTIQCLSEVNSQIPYFHAADFEKAIQEKPVDEDAGDADAAADDDDDPFKTMDADDTSQADDDDDNPFGGADDNPFAGADSKSDDDGDAKPADTGDAKPADDDSNPFGGGGDTDDDDDNPFGGGGN